MIFGDFHTKYQEDLHIFCFLQEILRYPEIQPWNFLIFLPYEPSVSDSQFLFIKKMSVVHFISSDYSGSCIGPHYHISRLPWSSILIVLIPGKRNAALNAKSRLSLHIEDVSSGDEVNVEDVGSDYDVCNEEFSSWLCTDELMVVHFLTVGTFLSMITTTLP